MLTTLLKVVPRKVWIGLIMVWWGQLFVAGFAGAALYDLLF